MHKKIDEYTSDYRREISEKRVTIEHLKKSGIKDSSLALEVYLRRHYGDEIVQIKASEDGIDGSQKVVQKIGEEEMSKNNEFRQIINEIENSEFDKNLEVLLKK